MTTMIDQDLSILHPTAARDRPGAVWQVVLAGLMLIFLRLSPVPMHPKFVVCGFHWLTGRPCPLCGMTRALSVLVKGDWLSAIHANALSPLMLAIFCGAILGGAMRLAGSDFFARFVPGILRRNFWTACVLLFLIYGVVRFFQIVP